MRTSRLLLSLVTAAGLAALAGCAAQPPTSDHPKVAGTIAITARPEPAKDQDITLPLDAYVPTDAQKTVIDNAEQLLIRNCMHTAGFLYRQTVHSVRIAHRPPFGLLDRAQAATYGYHDPGYFDGSKRLLPAKPAYLTDAYQIALQGWVNPPTLTLDPAPQGCLGTAEHRLTAEAEAQNPDLVGQIAGDAERQAEGDPRMVAVNRRWQSCMTRAGFSYETPQAAMDAPRSGVTTAPGQTEIDTAVADVDCESQVRLAAMWLALVTAYQQAGIESNVASLAQIQQDKLAAVDDARNILRSGH